MTARSDLSDFTTCDWTDEFCDCRDLGTIYSLITGVTDLRSPLLEEAGAIAGMPAHRKKKVVTSQRRQICLPDVATVLADTGMRPDECYRQRWEDLTWANGRNGSLLVAHGKTAAARRVLAMTSVLEARWNAAGKPLEG
jgi:hypothetical protein